MNCPKCGEKTCVKDTRSVDRGTVRLRFCNHCKTRFYTLETSMDYIDGVDKLAEFYREYYKAKKVRK